jgi:hypothetical protein
MSTHIRVNIGKPAHHRERHLAHDDNKQIPGWSKPREPKIEPPAVNRNIGAVGRLELLLHERLERIDALNNKLAQVREQIAGSIKRTSI